MRDQQEDANPLWRRFELSVVEMLSVMDRRSEILHDQKVMGRLSQCKRQIDVVARGTVIGIEMLVVVECKRHKRAIDIGVMDGFIGKLLDLGADRGVIYSYGGFTSAAVARAQAAYNPAVIAIALNTPEIVEALHSAPGYPADLNVQEFAPQWYEEMDSDAFLYFLSQGVWNKSWS